MHLLIILDWLLPDDGKSIISFEMKHYSCGFHWKVEKPKNRINENRETIVDQKLSQDQVWRANEKMNVDSIEKLNNNPNNIYQAVREKEKASSSIR